MNRNVRAKWGALWALLVCGCGTPPPVDFEGHWRSATRPLFQGFSDDFESGTLLGSESPAGKWTNLFSSAGSVSLGAVSAAAHRGNFGFRIVDGHNTSGAGSEGEINRSFLASPGDFYQRFWIRLTQSNGVGAILHAEVGDGNLYPFQLETTVAVGTLRSSGDVANGGASNDPPQSGLSVGRWHLVEMLTAGVGTSAGRRVFWLDGERRSDVAADFSGFVVSSEGLGIPWSADRTFTGTVDYDDYRSGDAAPASTLTVSGPSTGSRGDCVRLVFGLRTSEGQAAVAPYDVDVVVRMAGQLVPLNADAQCSDSGGGVIRAGAAEASVYVRLSASNTSASNTILVEVSHMDFIPAAWGIQVFPDPFATRLGCVASTPEPFIAWGLFGLLHVLRRRRDERIPFIRR